MLDAHIIFGTNYGIVLKWFMSQFLRCDSLCNQIDDYDAITLHFNEFAWFHYQIRLIQTSISATVVRGIF